MGSGEQRKFRRARVSWPVVVNVGAHMIEGETADIGPMGAKVRLPRPLGIGTPARLQVSRPDGPPLVIDAMVWRVDADGPVFFFLQGGPAESEVTRYDEESARARTSAQAPRETEPSPASAPNGPACRARDDEACAYGRWAAQHQPASTADPLRQRSRGPAIWELTDSSR